MSLIYRDRVRQKGTVTGTGAVTLSTPSPAYTLFGNANLGSNSFPYVIINDLQFEVGQGTFTTAAASGTLYGQINRNLVLANSNGDTNFINFDGSQCDVLLSNAAELSVLTSTAPQPSTFKIIKWTGFQYELIDPVENATTLGASIGSSLLFYNFTNTNFDADPNLKFLPGNTPELFVNGVLQATAKAFKIQHPTKPNMSLLHGCLEGPEYGIYLRGTLSLKYQTKIFLPDYFQALANNYTVYYSTDSFMPVKFKKQINSVEFKLMLPTIKNVNLEFLFIASRNDVLFTLES